jgi:hypothetical protein
MDRLQGSIGLPEKGVAERWGFLQVSLYSNTQDDLASIIHTVPFKSDVFEESEGSLPTSPCHSILLVFTLYSGPSIPPRIGLSGFLHR